LSFNCGEEVLIYCFGGSISKSNVSIGSTYKVLSCVNHLTFIDTSKQLEFPFSTITCLKNPTPSTIEDRTRKCNGIVVNIGYQVTDKIFKKTIDLCYIEDLAITTWAHTRIPGAIGGNKNRDSVTPAFTKGSYFNNVLISHVYSKSDQQKTFMKIFDNNVDIVKRYLPEKGNLTLI
jgi:hypothetical protein